MTLDGKHRIRQGDKGWSVGPTIDGSPFKTRGQAVAKLAELGLLPTEAPKPEQPKVEAKPRPRKGTTRQKVAATA